MPEVERLATRVRGPQEGTGRSQALTAPGPGRGRGRGKRPPRSEVERALRAEGGNLTETARALGCSRTALYRWCYQLGLHKLAGIVPREELLRQAAARRAEEAAAAAAAPEEADEVSVRKAEAPPKRRHSRPRPGMVTAGVRLPAEMWRWARIAAIDRNGTASDIVTEALEAFRAAAVGK